jgi:hypothetical protein
MHLAEDQKAEISSAIRNHLRDMYQNQRAGPYEVEILGEGHIALQSMAGIGKTEAERQAYKDSIYPELMREAEAWIGQISPTPGTDGGAAANRLKTQHAQENADRKLQEFDTPPDELMHELPAIDFELPDAQRLTWIEVIVTSADGCSESETILL